MNNVIIISEGSSQVILSGLNQGLLKLLLLCHCRRIISQPLSVPSILFDLPDVLKACHKVGSLITTLQGNDKSLFLSQSIYKLIPAPQTRSQLGCSTSETIHEQCGNLVTSVIRLNTFTKPFCKFSAQDTLLTRHLRAKHSIILGDVDLSQVFGLHEMVTSIICLCSSPPREQAFTKARSVRVSSGDSNTITLTSYFKQS